MCQRPYLRRGTKKLVKMGFGLTRTWRPKALGVCSSERLKIIRQIAEMLGKKKMAPLDILSKIDNIVLERGLAFSAAFLLGSSV